MRQARVFFCVNPNAVVIVMASRALSKATNAANNKRTTTVVLAAVVVVVALVVAWRMAKAKEAKAKEAFSSYYTHVTKTEDHVSSIWHATGITIGVQNKTTTSTGVNMYAQDSEGYKPYPFWISHQGAGRRVYPVAVWGDDAGSLMWHIIRVRRWNAFDKRYVYAFGHVVDRCSSSTCSANRRGPNSGFIVDFGLAAAFISREHNFLWGWDNQPEPGSGSGVREGAFQVIGYSHALQQRNLFGTQSSNWLNKYMVPRFAYTSSILTRCGNKGCSSGNTWQPKSTTYYPTMHSHGTATHKYLAI